MKKLIDNGCSACKIKDEELNNSENFHCKYYLTNDSGSVSCQKDLQKELNEAIGIIKGYIECHDNEFIGNTAKQFITKHEKGEINERI